MMSSLTETRQVVATGVYVYIVYCLFWEIFAYFGLRIDVYFCNIIAIDGGGWCVSLSCVSVLWCDSLAGLSSKLQFKKAGRFFK